MKIDPTTWRAARRGLEKAVALYLNDPNVSLIDLGFRTSSAAPHRFESALVVRVHVRRKLYGEAFRKFAAEQPHRVIAAQRIGFAIEVMEADYRLQLWHETLPQNKSDSPYNCGIHDANRLTIFGGKVRDRKNGEELILSSWHVLARICSAGEGRSIDASNDGTATAKYLRGAMHAGLDAAVARFCGDENFRPRRREISEAAGVVIPQLGMRVHKTGGNTGMAFGIVTGILGYAKQSYAGINCVIGPITHIAPEQPGMSICTEGDSGAWWLERSSSRAAALHFAGSDAPNFALALPMPNVLEALEVDVVSSPASPSATPPKSATTLAKRTAALQLQAPADETIVTAEAELLSEEELPVSTEMAARGLFKQTQKKFLKINCPQRIDEPNCKSVFPLGSSIRWATYGNRLYPLAIFFL